MKNLFQPVVGLVVFAVLVALYFFVLRGDAPEEMAETAIPDSDTPAEVVEGEPLPDLVFGDPDAPIEIIEYASFTCPHCARFHNDVLPRLKEEYITPGHAKLILREVYFDRFGLWAGMLARCGGEMRYYAITDLLFQRQSQWAKGEGPEIMASLTELGKSAGMSEEQIETCMQNEEQARALVQDFQIKSGRDEISATPTFLIDGEKMKNMNYDQFKEILDSKLN